MTPDEAEAWGVSRLRGVVERLEPKVGGINHLAAERGSNEGLMHLWFALHHAREALVAGIADQTLVAQVLELERAGLEKARAYQASKRGRSGARVTAPRNQASGLQTRESVLSLYDAEIEAGTKPAKAKRIVAERLRLSVRHVSGIVRLWRHEIGTALKRSSGHG